MLEESAKAMAGESFTYPSYITAGTTALTILPTDTTLSGETGSRVLGTSSRSAETLSLTGIKSGASILTATGTYLETVAAFTASTGGNYMTGVSLPSILQTTNFDIQFNFDWTYGRQS